MAWDRIASTNYFAGLSAIVNMPAIRLLSLISLASLIGSSGLEAQDVLTLPSANVGATYEYTIKSEGGVPPLRWSVVAGDLPKGIKLEPTGSLKGVPENARENSFEFSIEVKDSGKPAQSYVQRLKLTVAAAPLRIVHEAPLKIIAQDGSHGANNRDFHFGAPQQPEPRPASLNSVRAARWLVPVDQAIAGASMPGKLNTELQGQGSLIAETSDPCENPRHSKTNKQESPLDPSTFIHIVEDSKAGVPLCAYRYGNAMQFGIDIESSLRVIPYPRSMGEEPALNKLFITAKLTSGDSTKDVVVTGYSEVGKDKSAMPAQAGTAFESAGNVEAMVLNMAYVVGDIVHYVYHPADTSDTTPKNFDEWLKTQKEIDFKSEEVQKIDNVIATEVKSDTPFPQGIVGNDLERVQERLRLYQPEIKAISDFFLQPENLAIVERVGVDVFWIDRSSLQAIAQQYKDDIQIAVDDKSTSPARAQALQDLLERTKLVYKDFGDFRQDIRAKMQEDLSAKAIKAGRNFASETHTNQEWNAIFEQEILDYSKDLRRKAFKQLKNHLVAGSISLQDYQAKDGDRLTITVESLPASASTGGIPAVFYITLKKYGAKIQWSPSLLFVRRMGVTDSEANPPASSTASPVNRINFAASPGMTFGIAYFKRGNSGGDKFLRALGPGVGMNVTFMNFSDPSFDLSTLKFVNTTGTNVQVGAGIVGSLFDNKLQFSYGWNLNVEKRRSYIGVGFGFLEVGKEVAKYVTR